MTRVWTSRFKRGGAAPGCDGPIYFDVTRKSGVSGAGLIFAPSWRLLSPHLKLRQEGKETQDTWEEYKRDFLIEMRASYKNNALAWHGLLSRAELILCCYCVDPRRCHRAILAETILPKLGAMYCGEK